MQVRDRVRWLRRHGVTMAALCAYLVMTLLVIQQNQTIQLQRSLIRQLYADSSELNTIKKQRIREELTRHK